MTRRATGPQWPTKVCKERERRRRRQARRRTVNATPAGDTYAVAALNIARAILADRARGTGRPPAPPILDRSYPFHAREAS